MALTAAIAISQTIDCSSFTIQDISNYGGGDPKANISSRTLIIYKSDGTVFRGTGQLTDIITFDYVTYPTDIYTVQGLTKDHAFTVVVTLTPIAPQGGSIYSASLSGALVCNANTSFYNRNKKMNLDPRYENNLNFITDTWRIYMNKTIATDSAVVGNLTTAQLMLDSAALIESRNPQPY